MHITSNPLQQFYKSYISVYVRAHTHTHIYQDGDPDLQLFLVETIITLKI